MRTLIFAAALLAPSVAQANDMGGLAYVVLIWPIGVVLLILATVLGLVGRSFLGDPAHAHRVFSSVLLVVAGLLGVGYPLATWWIDQKFQARAPLAMMALSVVPVLIAAVILAVLGWKLRRP